MPTGSTRDGGAVAGRSYGERGYNRSEDARVTIEGLGLTSPIRRRDDLGKVECRLSVVDGMLGLVIDILQRPIYTERSAAELLRVPVATLHYWLEGGERRGHIYRPVIRENATGNNQVTWAEFVEAGLLREYRRNLHVPMAELRDFIVRLRDEFGVPYPLADRRPFTSGKHLVLAAQEASGLSPEYQLIAEVHNQPLLLPAADAFIRRVTWDEDVATAWRPDDFPDSPVIVNPEIRYGLPTVGGVRTEILWEMAESGDDVEDLAEMYGLEEALVRRAIAYELATRAGRAA